MSKKTSNLYGQVYNFAKECLTSLEHIFPGDHIAYERVKLYWHHCIVEDVDIEFKTVKVIHYHNNVREFFETTLQHGSIAQVKRSSLEFWPKRFYRIVYDANEVHPPEVVLENAVKRLGEKMYNPFTGNCEHFCTECKIGKSISIQVDTLIENMMVTVLPTITRGLLEIVLKKSVENAIEEFVKRTAVVYGKETLAGLSMAVFHIVLMKCNHHVGTQESWGALKQNTYVIVQGVVIQETKKLCFLGIREMFKNAGKLGGKKAPKTPSPHKAVRGMTKSGVLAGVAVELAFLGKDICDASTKKNDGSITEQEYEETVIKRVVGASVSTPMSLAGSIVGQYVLPVPFLGSMVGGVTGSAAGRILGAVASTQLIKNKTEMGKLKNFFPWK